MDKDAERKAYLDSARGIGILLVVLGHVSNRMVVGNDALGTWINSFHLPLFFVISGYLFALKNTKQLCFRDYLTKRAGTLLYPYLTFSLVYSLIYLLSLAVCQSMLPIHEAATLCVRIILGWGIGTLWFLPALFLAELLFWVIMRNRNKSAILASVILILSFGLIVGRLANGLWSEDGSGIYSLLYRVLCTLARACIGLFFIGIGYLLHKAEKYHVERRVLLVAAIVMFAANIPLSMLQKTINLRIALIGNAPLYLITGILGSVSLLLLLKELKPIVWLDWLGRNSLIIMATHEPFYIVALVAGFFTNMVKERNTGTYLLVFVVFIWVMLIEVLLILLIKRYVPFLTQYKKREV